LWMGLFSFSE